MEVAGADVVDQHVRRITGLDAAEQLLEKVAAALVPGHVGDLDVPTAGIGEGLELRLHECVVVGMEVGLQQNPQWSVERRRRRSARNVLLHRGVGRIPPPEEGSGHRAGADRRRPLQKLPP